MWSVRTCYTKKTALGIVVDLVVGQSSVTAQILRCKHACNSDQDIRNEDLHDVLDGVAGSGGNGSFSMGERRYG